ncbi:DUF2079 domain-containing protein [Phormidium sp. CLA17]|uniref:DUF2079 domain-containing protein n=1 Tax=Leptolyngbya sp. Cla-17 TaxID=2803751 RepID=UPI001491E62C|nr:DUF2079 domain-containing protein [Leptolyngbya sp. Cla-17]MBM0743071.1 DUF2079 domain-containing protein [Leptolyngbya sp. Cla-17]
MGNLTVKNHLKTFVPTRSLLGLLIVSAAIFLASSTLRHGLFHSNAWDLGIFDQPLYLLSRGLPPISSIIGVHILGDHAAWIFYPLAGLYWLYPNVHWLFAVQALSLALGVLPTYHLAKQAGLREQQALAIATAYLLYPLIFNLNLFDFHPEVIALPLILTAVWLARADLLLGFVICIVVALGCRDALALTVAAMGVWLIVFEKRPLYGAIAFVAGLVWFYLATHVILPYFQTAGVLGLALYAELGNSIPEIALNLVLKPDVVLRRVMTFSNLGYLVILCVPLAWGLAPRHFAPLVAAVPQLAMNLLSEKEVQKNLVHQYSLPILPFMLLVVIASLAADDTWIQRPKTIVLWSLVAFMALGQWHLFGTRYLSKLSTWQATRSAIAHVTTENSVLAPAALTPHLSHRSTINVVSKTTDVRLENYYYLLLNQRHPGGLSTPEIVLDLVNQAKKNPCFQLSFQQDDVFLFQNSCGVK